MFVSSIRKKLFLIIVIFLLPTFVFAQNKNSICSADGYTVITLNGVFTNEKNARLNKQALEYLLPETYKSENLKVDFLHNPSHLSGIGDLAKSVYQKYFDEIAVKDYDLTNMLTDASEKVHTQKLLLVAHSQGNFYANSFYDVIADQVGGVPKESIGVYGIATPAGRVAGGGKWLTSDTDRVIADWVALAPFKDIMEPNTHIKLQNGDDFLGHNFSDVYLKYRGERIVSDIQTALNQLSANNVQDEQKICFDAPKLTLAHKATGAALAVADAVVNITATVIDETVDKAAVAVDKTNKFFVNLGDKVNNLAVGAVGGLFADISSIFENGNGGDLRLVAEISIKATGEEAPPARLAVAPAKRAGQVGKSENVIVRNTVEQINNSDRTNRIDAVNQPVVLADTQDEDAAEREANKQTTNDNQTTTNNLQQTTVNSPVASVGSGQGEVTVQQCKYGAGGAPTRQKLIINEVAWMGGLVSANDEWLELKNISGSELDVSGWQVLDKNEDVKVTLANGKKLPAGGFLLLERTNDDSVPGIAADVVYSGALSNTDEGLRLFDNNCNLVDEVLANPNWPAGDSAARKTMERSSDLNWHTYSGSGENNIFGTPKTNNSQQTTDNGQTANNGNQQQITGNLVISEVQITGGTGQSDNEFIELYNPNNSAIDLSVLPLKLHIRNSNGADSHKTLTFVNNTVPAKGYFLIGPFGGYTGSAALDATYSASSGNKLVNNGGVYISKSATADTDILDKVGWGTQPAGGSEAAAFSESPIANQSISRNAETDTNNNASDFIKSKPTPKNSGISGGFLSPDAWVVLEQLVSHLAISEIYPDRTGANRDFVEIYNPNATSTGDLDISSWSLQVLSASATTTDKITKKNFVAGNKISGRGFFLVGIDNYSSGDMNWPSGSLNSTDGATIFLVSGTTTILSINDSRIVDRVSYGGGSATDFAEAVPVAMPVSGRSLERKAFQNDFCLTAQTGGEFLGNGCDTDNNFEDFEVRLTPNPQGLSNLIEPRSAPSAIQNFFITYSTTTLSAVLNWDLSKDYSDATSSVQYFISYATSTSATLKGLAQPMATGTYVFGVNEVGVTDKFSIYAKDKDGLASEAASKTLEIPGLIKDLFFYTDPRSASTTALELRYYSYPFIPNSYFSGGSWRTLVFYKNQEAPAIPYFNSDDQYAGTPNGISPKQYGEWGTTVDGAWKLKYLNCGSYYTDSTALILPDTSERCSNGYGGIRNSTFNWSKLEDLNLIIPLSGNQPAPADGDYLTAVFYAYAGNNEQRLVAVDRKKYYFGTSTPTHQSPAAPKNLELQNQATSSLLRIVWDKSTDSDTSDSALTYEINYSTGALFDSGWQTIPNVNLNSGEVSEIGGRGYTKISVEPDTNYNISLRAKDDFGNISSATTTTFFVPDVALPYGMSDVQWGNLSGSSAAEINFDADPYPFMSSDKPTAIIFFLNQSPPVNYSFSNWDNYDWDLSRTNKVLRLGYNSCGHADNYDIFGSLIMNNNPACLPSWHGLKGSSAGNNLSFGQTSFTIRITGIYNNGAADPYSFSASDYITLGFYELQGSDFRQVNTYNKKIYPALN